MNKRDLLKKLVQYYKIDIEELNDLTMCELKEYINELEDISNMLDSEYDYDTSDEDFL